MSHTELERLARIRIQVTGETLERALAVLRGDTTEAEPASLAEAATGPGSGPGPAPRTDPDLDAEASSTSAADPDREAESPHQPRPPRRQHLRGL